MGTASDATMWRPRRLNAFGATRRDRRLALRRSARFNTRMPELTRRRSADRQDLVAQCAQVKAGGVSHDG
jgi:hypothetical protein